ncbi:MAG: hypothetical protein AAB707_00815 [Patescibacteria group bacterium]
MWKIWEKKVDAIKELEKKQKAVIEFFSSDKGRKVFERVIGGTDNNNDKESCPLSYQCYVWYAKAYDNDFPNFFLNPCWEIRSCICPLRKSGCDNCLRKLSNKPLC